jgi:hypothetical protein
MKTIKMIWKRLTRDFVDMLLWFSVIAILIRTLIDSKIEDQLGFVMLFFGSLLILYIAGVMWRMGAATEIMNEYIKDDNDRKMLGMLPYQFRDKPRGKGWQAWLFAAIWIVVLIIFVIL